MICSFHEVELLGEQEVINQRSFPETSVIIFQHGSKLPLNPKILVILKFDQWVSKY